METFLKAVEEVFPDSDLDRFKAATALWKNDSSWKWTKAVWTTSPGSSPMRLWHGKKVGPIRSENDCGFKNFVTFFKTLVTFFES